MHAYNKIIFVPKHHLLSLDKPKYQYHILNYAEWFCTNLHNAWKPVNLINCLFFQGLFCMCLNNFWNIISKLLVCWVYACLHGLHFFLCEMWTYSPPTCNVWKMKFMGFHNKKIQNFFKNHRALLNMGSDMCDTNYIPYRIHFWVIYLQIAL